VPWGLSFLQLLEMGCLAIDTVAVVLLAGGVVSGLWWRWGVSLPHNAAPGCILIPPVLTAGRAGALLTSVDL
jgi:hypothetical protein